MSPRPYRMGQRQAIVEETRARVLAAARAVLTDPSGYKAFTVDAVAQAADVARPTVYYQFGSKRGLIEALCDNLAAEGRMDDLAAAFSEPDPMVGLERLVAVFAQFWACDRAVTRRLRALAALDPDIGHVIGARDERRRQALGVLIGRMDAGSMQPAIRDTSATVAVLAALTSFETFETIAGADGSADGSADGGDADGRVADEVARVVVRLLPTVLAMT